MLRLKIFAKVSGANGTARFENANFFYRFGGNYRQAETLQEADIKRLGFTHNDLAQIVAAMYNAPTPLVTRYVTRSRSVALSRSCGSVGSDRPNHARHATD